MPVEPATQAVLDLIEQLGMPPVHEMTPEVQRAAFAAFRDPSIEGGKAVRKEWMDADGVPVLVTWPEAEGTLPILVWIHGGGWVIGTAEEADVLARNLGAAAGCIVVNVDYRLAPEFPFPTPVDDVLTASRWVKAHAEELGGDPARLAVGGDSAGGNLSAVACQQLPGTFAFQLLVYPAVDATYSFPSIDENAEGYLLTKQWMLWFQGHYLPEGTDLKDPRISPFYADDVVVAATPPALVITAEFDPLRDEGEAYATRLESLGVPVELRRFDGTIHGFFGMDTLIPLAAEAQALAADALRRSFT